MALEKNKGNTEGPKLIEAFKGLSWESPRGPISIDPETRDIVQNIYIRRVERKDGELYHIEFQTFPNQRTRSKRQVAMRGAPSSARLIFCRSIECPPVRSRPIMSAACCAQTI